MPAWSAIQMTAFPEARIRKQRLYGKMFMSGTGRMWELLVRSGIFLDLVRIWKEMDFIALRGLKIGWPSTSIMP